MAAGARITITTTKHVYDLYDSVDASTTIDDKAQTPRFQLKLDTVVVNPGCVQRAGSTAGYRKFSAALKAYYQMVRYYENH